MIPKIIHFCWLSNDPYPEKVKECLASWQKHCPDYKIIKWDLSRFDIDSNQWVKEAFNAKKYAFAADYIRLFAIYNHGGIYLDSDVLLFQSLDVFLSNESFSVIEYYPDIAKKIKMDKKLDDKGFRLQEYPITEYPFGIQAAIIGSESKNPFIFELLSYYENRHFINDDGSMNTNPIAPGIYATIAERHGLAFIDKFQTLDNFTLYPSYYLASIPKYRNKKNIGMHNCAHSWDDRNEHTLLNKIKALLKRIL